MSEPFEFRDAEIPADPGTLVVKLARGITSTDRLLGALAEGLSFPPYFGRNWNALEDCLRDLHWIAQRRVVLVHADLPALAGDDWLTYVDVLAHAVDDWRRDARHVGHELVVVFPANAEGAVREALGATSPA
jgi:hypothetical protein